MDSRPSSLIVFAIFALFIFSHQADAFNITKILGGYSQLSSFNDLLTETKLAEKINKRQTITLLALDNGAAGSIKGRSSDELQSILSNHVVLDYYDALKLKKLEGKGSTLTTLYQTTGSLVAKLVKSVYSQPFNLSILQVSMPIVAPGIGDPILPPPPPPYSAPPPSLSRKAAPSPKSSMPTDTGEDSSEDSSEAPSSEAQDEAPVPSPAESPAASSKEKAGSDVADYVQPPPHSSASTMLVGSSIGVVGVMALVLNFAGL